MLGEEITMVECSTNQDDEPHEYSESYTWTFYRMATMSETIVVRWYGSSNGYYSETTSFYMSKAPRDCKEEIEEW